MLSETMPYEKKYAEVNGIDVVVSRTGFSSEVGFEVYLLGYERGEVKIFGASIF